MDQATVSAVLSTILAAALSAGLVRAFCEPASRFHWLDRPNARSLHERPTPRTGGIGIMGGIAAGWLSAGMPLTLIFCLALLLAAVSVCDDAKGLPIWLRLASHATAAGAFAASGHYDVWLIVPAFLAIVWMTNLYNFMDGSDGLAGGMALIGFGWCAIAAGQAGATALMTSSLIVAAASAAFLLFNFSPARIFMGDAGSIPLGFLAAAVGLEGWRTDVWAVWFPVLVFSPFIVDATVTLLRRGLRGEKVWQAHREHAYQRLVRLGWTHRRVALVAYGIMAATGASAWLLNLLPVQQQWFGLALWGGAYVALFLAVDNRWRRKESLPS